MRLTLNSGAETAVKCVGASVLNVRTTGSHTRYAVQTKISYDLNREVSPCVISSNYKEPIAVLELTRE